MVADPPEVLETATNRKPRGFPASRQTMPHGPPRPFWGGDETAGTRMPASRFCCCQAESRIPNPQSRSEEHTSELQSLMRISYAVFCLKKKKNKTEHNN